LRYIVTGNEDDLRSAESVGYSADKTYQQEVNMNELLEKGVVYIGLQDRK